MNVLFLSLVDFSSIEEQGIYTDLLRKFTYENHKVFVISPSEKRKKIKSHLIKNENTTILKLKIGNITKTNILEKGLSIMLLEYKFTNAIKKYFSNIKFDLILYPTPPITFLRTVSYIKKRDNALAYLLLKDIFPQNAIDLEILDKKSWKKYILNVFLKKEMRLYEISDVIGCMSIANVEYVKGHHSSIDEKKIEICPNSLELIKHKKVDRDAIRKKYNIPLEKTVLIYGGNIGKPQGVKFIMECLSKNELLNNSFILIVGDGTEYISLKRFFDSQKPKNSKLIRLLPRDEYEQLVQSSDIGLIFLDHRFTIPNFPSRLLSYMQASKPIIACTDKNTDIGKMIVDNQFGFWCESIKSDDFIKIIDEEINNANLYDYSKNSREYFETEFSVEVSFKAIKKHLIEGDLN